MGEGHFENDGCSLFRASQVQRHNIIFLRPFPKKTKVVVLDTPHTDRALSSGQNRCVCAEGSLCSSLSQGQGQAPCLTSPEHADPFPSQYLAARRRTRELWKDLGWRRPLGHSICTGTSHLDAAGAAVGPVTTEMLCCGSWVPARC